MAPVHNDVHSPFGETKDRHMNINSLVLGNMGFRLMGSLLRAAVVSLVLGPKNLPSGGPGWPSWDSIFPVQLGQRQLAGFLCA